MICSSGSALLLGVGLLSLSANATLFTPEWNEQNTEAWRQFDETECNTVSDKLTAFKNDKSTLGTWSEDGTFTDGRKVIPGKWWNAHVPSKAYDDTLDYVVYCQQADFWVDQGHFENMAVSALCDKGEGIGDHQIGGRWSGKWVSGGGCIMASGGGANSQTNGNQAAYRNYDNHCGCKKAPPPPS